MAEIPFEPYTGQSKLRFWCQKVLPLVYDDSLSYYELLGKVVEYLNNTITDVSACEDNITALRDAFVHLQDYVNEVLDDFAPEVEQVIDEMIDSGEFGEILANVVNGLIANEYSTTQGYAQFDYVLKDGKLYCATASTSGEWDATKWRETTVGADMQLLNQRVYNLNAGQVAFNESTTYDNGTVGKKLKDLDDFDDNLNAGQVAFNESTTYDNNTVGKKLKDLDDFDDNLNAGQVAFNESTTYDDNTVGKKLKDLDDFDDNLNAGQVAFNESATYGNGTVGKKLKDLDDFDDNINAGQVAFNESTTYDSGSVGKKLKDLDDFDDNLNAGQVAYNSEGTYNNATVGKELQELNNSLNTNESAIAIVANGNTHTAIASGQYVYIKNHSTLAEGLYKATTAIPLNDTLSSTNVAAVSNGGINDLDAAIKYRETNIIYPLKDHGTWNAVLFGIGIQIDSNRIYCVFNLPFFMKDFNYSVNLQGELIRPGFTSVPLANLNVDSRFNNVINVIAQSAGTTGVSYPCRLTMSISYD